MSSEKKCCKRLGSLLGFGSIAVWISYYYQTIMNKAVGLPVEDISIGNHLIVFILLFVPAIYLTKFKK